MTPCRATRPDFFSWRSRPWVCRSWTALSRSPPACSRARRQSMTPAPVFSRSSLIVSVVIAAIGVPPGSGGAPRARRRRCRVNVGPGLDGRLRLALVDGALDAELADVLGRTRTAGLGAGLLLARLDRLGHLGLADLLALDHGVGDLGREQLDGADRV